jgi:peptidoglycan hydrolase-like protein with peptidoglycan-binding domain
MSVSAQKAVDYFNNSLYKGGAIYLWGANGEIITKALCDKLYAAFKSNTYNKAYYDGKLKEGAGKIGADCSGAMYPLSGADNTAAGYYNKCVKKGAIGTIPTDTVCLVFKKNTSGNIYHIGLYTGDGYVTDMRSSKANCKREKLSGGGWNLWGIPSWITYDSASTTTTSASTTHTSGTTAVKIDGVIDTVLEVQNWLNTNYKTGLTEDNVYGSKTKQGLVKAFQTALNNAYKSGLAVDGSYGTKTQAAVAKNLSSGLHKGDKGELVKVLQAALICKGYDYCALDGSFGSNTDKAVRAYQTKKGLSVDGYAGKNTLKSMFA